MTATEFERATPVLMSGDYERSKAFYTETLGFRVIEEGGDPARFGIFERGGAVLFVNAWNGARARRCRWACGRPC